jgi:Ribose/xylose/arabinose/galactoside ABC-type transport systems, permease components
MSTTTPDSGRSVEGILAQSDPAVASFEEHGSGTVRRIQNYLHTNPAAVPLIVLLGSLICFGALLGGKLFSAFTLTLILQQVAITGIIGAAQTLVILTAGIDLSVGAIMVLSSVVMGQFTFRYGLPPALSILCGFAVGTICGLVNGLLVSKMRLPPFIVTLGTWQIILAINYIYSANETIRSQDIDETAPILKFFANDIRAGGAVFTYGVISMVLLVLLLWYVLNHTAWGRHVYAVGDDPEAAELSGVRTSRVLLQVYTLAGIICAFGAWVLIGRVGAISPNSGAFANIESITAVVIGGISLFGGRGSILGMIFGALIVGLFSLALRLLGTDPQYTYMMIGVLIILAVAVDQWIRKVAG